MEFSLPRYEVRRKFFSRGVNRSSMSIIDTAAFFVVLDDFDHEIDRTEPSTLGDNGKVSEIYTRTPFLFNQVESLRLRIGFGCSILLGNKAELAA